MMKKITTLTVLVILGLTGLLLFGYNKLALEDELQARPLAYQIIREWKLPKELDEISGIDRIGANKLACIQDEDGIIFNLQTSKVEQRIDFAGAGDYEDIRVLGEDAYILRSDGTIFEVQNFMTAHPQTTSYTNFLTENQNLESLAWDKGNNRLLLAIKDREPKDDTYKGIYQFSLANKELQKQPVYRLSMKDSLFKDRKTKFSKILQPSALAIYPVNNNYYVLDGRAPQLIIADKDMKLKKRYLLDKDDFKQAEGLTFSKEGTLYISNEGKGGKANILEVVLK